MQTTRRLTFWAAALVAALHAPSHATEPPISLWCARGVPDFPDAQLRLGADGHHVVDVTFVDFRPSRMRADWSLRDCLSTAARLDGSRDIVARLWYRERYVSGVEPLPGPHGASATLVYKADRKAVVVERRRP